MAINIYNVIMGPITTSKAYSLNQRNKKLVLRVHPDANKIMIKEALQKLFNVKVEKIGTSIRQGKNKRVGRYATKGVLVKKAIVTLKKGYSMDLANQATGGEQSSSGGVAV